MNQNNTRVPKILFAFIFSCFSFVSVSQSSYELWERNFKNALKSGDVRSIKSYFSDDFMDEEIESWKYELKRGHLIFSESSLIRLDSSTILMYIPTGSISYNGDNHNEYFDFIYRIYKIDNKAGMHYLSKRVMDEYKPDFLNYNLNVNVDSETNTFIFESNILTDIKSPHLLLKLAKEFEILDFQINGKKSNYDKLGYFLYSATDTVGIHEISIQGRLKAPQTNNQFISMNENSFFIRFGGFAAIPSPPPDNNGRNFFSADSTNFEITYTYPKEYTFLNYGNPSKTILLNDQKQTKATVTGTWMDEIACYAQKDWEKKTITHGNTNIGFYFKKNDIKERNYIIAEVDTLLQWINMKFDNYGSFKINFVVLDNFVKEGLLNDSRSIIAQNAEIIGSGGIGYLHEICHSAPQPSVAGNYLWIKEGFTNFLSYEYLFSQKEEEKIWKDLKRKYLHCFDLYEEPLKNIRSTGIPTYWAAYSKASWVFRMLESVLGKDDFQQVLYKLGTMDDTELRNNHSYLEIFERVSGKKLTKFENQWLNFKENPVLTVHGQLEKERNTGVVRIRVLQKEPYFTLPLEVEIKTENKTYWEIIQIQGKETVFEKPIKEKGVSIQYDPDSRLFAIIKGNKKTFTEGLCDNLLPKDTAIYDSEGGQRKIQVWFTKTKKRVNIFKKDGNQESILELTNKLSPVSYRVNGDTIFTQDLDNKTIKIKNRKYDIAEPIYPKEFIPFLFSIVDWNDVSKLSLLYLIPGSLDCQVIHCELEKTSEQGFEWILKEPLSEEKLKTTSKNGYPKSFNTLDGKKCYLRE